MAYYENLPIYKKSLELAVCVKNNKRQISKSK